MVGLSSSIFIAVRATDNSNTPAASTLEGLNALSDMAAELQYTQSVTEQATTAVTVTVPDRDDPDTIPETIRFAWSGAAGDPLTRQYNGGTVATFVENVHDFGIQYFQPTAAVEHITIWIQANSDSRTSVETSVPLLNQP
jgi:hypothetical protein